MDNTKKIDFLRRIVMSSPLLTKEKDELLELITEFESFFIDKNNGKFIYKLHTGSLFASKKVIEEGKLNGDILLGYATTREEAWKVLETYQYFDNLNKNYYYIKDFIEEIFDK